MVLQPQMAKRRPTPTGLPLSPPQLEANYHPNQNIIQLPALQDACVDNEEDSLSQSQSLLTKGFQMRIQPPPKRNLGLTSHRRLIPEAVPCEGPSTSKDLSVPKRTEENSSAPKYARRTTRCKKKGKN